LTLQVNGDRYKDAVANVIKSSAKESNEAQPDIALNEGKLVDRLKPNEMATYVFEVGKQSGSEVPKE